jgi:hypothetical protein
MSTRIEIARRIHFLCAFGNMAPSLLAPRSEPLDARIEPGNTLTGVFKLKDAASVVALYLGYKAW